MAAGCKYAEKRGIPSALDAANEKVLFARDQVLDAIRRGDQSRAVHFYQEGLQQTNHGATLNMQELSPDLTRVPWHVKRWEQQMRDTVEQYNRELDEGKASREDVKSMQQSLKNLGLYDGGVTGRYDESFLYAVTSFQQLSMLGEIASTTKEVNIPYVDGKVTSNLASAAKGAYFKNRELASIAVVSVGIREGYNQWREDHAHQVADAAINFNPFDKEFWSTTIEELGALAKAFAKGEITKDDIVLSVALNEWEELKKSAARVEDIWHLATKVVNKTITFEESKQLGAYVAEAEMALSVVVGTWGTGALASKLGKIAPRIFENLKAVGKEYLDSRKDKVEGIGKVTVRQLDEVLDAGIINRVKEIRGSLTSTYKKSGNFALAEVNVTGISKREFYAHSSIDELSGTLKERVPDISTKPTDPIFMATKAPNKNGDVFLRDSDTEYKILNDLAAKLGTNTDARGAVKLFTELHTCDSCTRIINEFAAKYKNIKVEVIHNNDVRIMP